jgi:Bax protein
MNQKKRQAVLVHTLLVTAIFAGVYHQQNSTTANQQAVIAPERTTFVPAQLSSYVLDNPYQIDLPDFASISNVRIKKQLFFDFLQPFIDAKNAEVQQQRRQLLFIAKKVEQAALLSHGESRFLWELSQSYDVPTTDLQAPAFIERLLLRVDVLPPSLVLAQAANESGWGTSRFAQEGNNLFGLWCYTRGCGLIPASRSNSANHEVKSFASIEEAVNAYFQNLNTFPSYQDLRQIREQLRESAKPIDGISLSRGLGKYSERGADYIQDVQKMIYKNNLQARDRTLYP